MNLHAFPLVKGSQNQKKIGRPIGWPKTIGIKNNRNFEFALKNHRNNSYGSYGSMVVNHTLV